MCKLRTDQSLTAREHHLSSAQMFAMCTGPNCNFYESLRLKNEVFPIMRSDDISKAAMGDVLICSYAESLLRKHRRPQIKNVISNKMRELGRLLLTLREASGCQILLDTLKPEMFDHFVAATKIISGYNEETQSFKASSLALHMGTTLKQICDMATKLLIKKTKLLPYEDSEKCLKEIKRLKNLFENHWSSKISSLALKNLNENKYEKPKLMPLTTDIMKFNNYVSRQAREARDKLMGTTHPKANFRLLSECILALTLLLNRKRIGEVQFLKVENYIDVSMQNVQEEFLQALSESEKILTKSFKRVVTLGKGSKPIPLLFSTTIQELINVLLAKRNVYISQKNPYLFANPNTTDKYLSGYHTIKKLAENSEVSNTTLFTSTRLRKQIATVLQVLNITESEFEQFARFMGHTKKTHATYYRLSQDVYETAKISKMLLTINSGKTQKYQGKTLEDIEISDAIETDSDTETEEKDAGEESSKSSRLPSKEIILEENYTDASDDSAARPSRVHPKALHSNAYKAVCRDPAATAGSRLHGSDCQDRNATLRALFPARPTENPLLR
ncbi:uncharacterized protein LOC126749344 [Anthonomus grandis grandis]|uniref:uncharacterized protein LOC126749344 n=1 Tax=Anthonomus grandis grandis TaxID=2921223 RepID=UPI002165402C|nr:uncharacterized protein LOC126749344 [Anthonomus grandis grandis]